MVRSLQSYGCQLCDFVVCGTSHTTVSTVRCNLFDDFAQPVEPGTAVDIAIVDIATAGILVVPGGRSKVAVAIPICFPQAARERRKRGSFQTTSVHRSGTTKRYPHLQ